MKSILNIKINGELIKRSKKKKPKIVKNSPILLQVSKKGINY
jgi:hypothetical protein